MEYELDPLLLVAQINQLSLTATVGTDHTASPKSFKLRATDVKAMALEIKDFLGRSEYNAIDIYKVTVTPDRVAMPGETYMNALGAIVEYEPGGTVKGSTFMHAILRIQE